MLYFLGVSCECAGLMILYLTAAAEEAGPIDPACLAQSLIAAALFGLTGLALIAVGGVKDRLEMLIDAIERSSRRWRM